MPSERRTIHVEPAVHEFWERPNRHRFELGFLVGQSDVSGTNDLVLAAVEVPSEEPDLDHDIEIVQGFDDLSVEWVVDIATQIDRLLPGGIEIVGLYVVALADAESATDRAALYLRAIASALALPPGFAPPTETAAPEHHCIVYISSATSATSAKSFTSVRDAPRTVSATATLASPSSDARLQIKTFAASVAIEETIVFQPPTATDIVDVAETRLSEFQKQLEPLAQRVWQARGVATTADRMELVSPSVLRSDKSASGETSRCRGVIECVAFVPTNDPRAVELAAFYLKRDFVRSLLARIDLLLERFADEEGAADDAFVLRDGGLLKLPKRGLISWRSGATPSSDALQLSVLALGEDDEGTVVQNALEILSAGDELPGVDIDLGVESLRWLESDAEVLDTSSAPGVSVSPSSAARPHSKPKAATATTTSSNNVLFVVLPLVLLLLALLYAKFQ